MNGILNVREIKELFRSEKKIKIILITGVIVIFTIALSGLTSDKTNESDKVLFNYSQQKQYEEALETRLANVLSQIDGIGDIRIMIALDSSEENIFSAEKKEVASVKTPSIRGVIIVCDGGDNIIIREKVISAVAGVFGISTTRISVIK